MIEKEEETVYDQIGKSFVKGAAAGILSSIILQPLDLLKSRLQYHYVVRKTGNYNNNSNETKNVKNDRNNKSIRNTIKNNVTRSNNHLVNKTTVMELMKTIIKNEGITSLWNGIGPSLIRVCGGVGIYFSSLELMTSYRNKKNKKLNIIPNNNNNLASTFLIGASARSLAGVIMLPVTVVKTRFEAKPPSEHGYKNTFNAFSQIIKNESWSGLYRGLTPTLVRDVPFSGIYLILYQNLRVYTIDYYQVKENNLPPHNSNNVKHYKNKIKDEKLPTYINFSIGFIAGSIATALTHPFDVIKTRMQVTKRFENEKISNYFKDIYTKEGSVGLSRGLFLRVIKRPLSTAMVWTVYEALKM